MIISPAKEMCCDDEMIWLEDGCIYVCVWCDNVYDPALDCDCDECENKEQ
jgi:hypothetical protein